MAIVRSCDYGHDVVGSGKVRRLNTGGGAGVYVCKKHWDHEMRWRKERNKTLTGKAKFPILKWPGK